MFFVSVASKGVMGVIVVSVADAGVAWREEQRKGIPQRRRVRREERKRRGRRVDGLAIDLQKVC